MPTRLRSRLARILAYATAVLLLAAVALLAPVDRTPYLETEYYRNFRRHAAALPPSARPSAPADTLRVGWAKVSITPDHPLPLAGYGQRWGKPYTGIHDSIWVRAFVFDNGRQKAAMLTADLLIIAPEVTNALARRLPEVGLTLDQTYLCATHTHNSMGGWANRLVGRLIAGAYDPEVVAFLADRFLEAIRRADRHRMPATLGTAAYPAGELVHNRLNRSHRTDSLVRVLKMRRKDGSMAALVSFSAHATMLPDTDLRLSRDYPGVLVDSLEKHTDVDMAAFFAGAVGSHSTEAEGSDAWDALANEAGALTRKIRAGWARIPLGTTTVLRTLSVPLPLRAPHFRIAKNWRVRPWVFYGLYGNYPVSVKGLRLGNSVWVGLPCDFSGELTAGIADPAAWADSPLFITSFNGGYIGYVTPDAYYDWPFYETRDMNWFGPGNGAYFSEAVREMAAHLRR